MTPSDQKHRDQARLKLGANMVVEAGAGTGKTSLLVDRILFLVLGARGSGPLPVTGVVALTFTEKAAGEIKLRLADRLAEIIAALTGGGASPRAQGLLEELRSVFDRKDEQILASARQALERLDRAPIGTIHSFAAQLLRLYPIEAGVDPGFRVDERDAFEELFSSEWASWLDEQLGERAPRGDEWRRVLRLAPLDDLEDLARSLCGEGVELPRAGCADPGAAGWLEQLAEGVEAAAKGQPAPKGNSRILESINEVCARLRALAQAARQDELPAPAALDARKPRASTWPKGWDAKGEGEGVYKRALGAAADATAESEALLRRACELLRPFADSFRQTFARRGLVSFDGLLLRARDLVRDRLDVREKLKREFEALLIDEFQDTDPLQGELLLYLAEAEGGRAERWQDVRLGAGRLFVVGDPKQSIYRFRGADMAAYQRFTGKILEEPGALRCDLTTNFRSPAELLSPVNAVFAPLMREQAGLQAAYKALESAGKGDGRPAIELVAFVPEVGRESLTASAGQAAEAAWLSDWIVSNCGPGKPRRFKDVAVLLKTSAPLAAILEAFKARAIPYAVEMERFFYGAQEIVDFLNLLKALDDPQDTLAVAALLRSPLVALEDSFLYAARDGGLDYLRPRLEGLPTEARKRLEEFYAVLRGLRVRVGRRPLGELVRAVLEETPLLEVCARAYHGQQTAANLWKLSRLAAAASDEKGMTLGEFIGRVAADTDGARSEGENPLADEHLEAVRVMTVHKSKGLEFPVVFLANASGGRGSTQAPAILQDWGSGRLGLSLPRCGARGASMARLLAEESDRQEHETLRLLYVALTRAREKLLVLGAREGDKNSLSRRLATAGAWPQEEAQSGLIRLAGAAPMRAVLVEAVARPLRASASPARAATAPPSASQMGKLWARRAQRAQEASGAAWVRRPTDGVEDEGSGLNLTRVSLVKLRPDPIGLLIGQLCHSVLERWDFNGRGDVAAAVEHARARLSRTEPGAAWTEASREAEAILRGFLSSPAARALSGAHILGREVPFVYGQDGAVMRGALDLLYRKDGRLVVADYKTEAVSRESLPKLRAKYERQGEAYREAVRRAMNEEAEFRLVFLRAPDLA